MFGRVHTALVGTGGFIDAARSLLANTAAADSAKIAPDAVAQIRPTVGVNVCVADLTLVVGIPVTILDILPSDEACRLTRRTATDFPIAATGASGSGGPSIGIG